MGRMRGAKWKEDSENLYESSWEGIYTSQSWLHHIYIAIMVACTLQGSVGN